jgi:hypothetical protein
MKDDARSNYYPKRVEIAYSVEGSNHAQAKSDVSSVNSAIFTSPACFKGRLKGDASMGGERD